MKILVADDAKPNRIVVGLILRQAGHEVVEVEDGIEALALLQQGNFDAAFLDIRMPGLSGLEVCRRVRDDVTLSRLHLVACTAHEVEHAEQSVLDAGFDHFVSKPIDRVRLLAALLER